MGLLNKLENYYMRHKPRCMGQYIHLEEGEHIVLDVEHLGALKRCSLRRNYFPICNNDTTSWNIYVVVTNYHLYLFNQYSCVKLDMAEIRSVETRRFLWGRYIMLRTDTDDCSFTVGSAEDQEEIVKSITGQLQLG